MIFGRQSLTNPLTWLTCANPKPMLEFLRGKASARKLRLFAVESCRRNWEILTDERSRRAAEVAEQIADGFVGVEERNAAEAEAREAAQEFVRSRQRDDPEMFTLGARVAVFTLNEEFADIEVALAIVAGCNLVSRNPASPMGSRENECAASSSSLREIFGNPLQSVAIDREWRTSTAVTIAAQMYESRDFSAMPILADALQDAGCEHDDVLNHCRSSGPHIRGCWVVDLVLGKA